MKTKQYIAPCVKKTKGWEAVTFSLVIGGIILTLGGIGNGTTDLNIPVMVAGVLLSGWGASRITRP